MGRPSLGKAARKTLVALRLTEDEALRWAERVADLRTTLSEYVRSLVEKDIARAAKKEKRR